MNTDLDIHQVCKGAAITRIQLNQWISRGYFRPANEPVNGKARTFSINEAITLGVFAELTRIGVPYDVAAQHSRLLHGFKDEAALLVVYQGPQELIATSERGAPPPAQSSGVKFYDPAMPPMVGEIIKISKLGDLAANPDVRSMAVVNIDHVESRVKAAMTASDQD